MKLLTQNQKSSLYEERLYVKEILKKLPKIINLLESNFKGDKYNRTDCRGYRMLKRILTSKKEEIEKDSLLEINREEIFWYFYDGSFSLIGKEFKHKIECRSLLCMTSVKLNFFQRNFPFFFKKRIKVSYILHESFYVSIN